MFSTTQRLLALFMLQMVMAGNGIADMGSGVESEETTTGLVM